ncbi:hypothetical protein GGR51DRAFT_574979 [Nemania sp. FL0031]|nr:hypothetical protein GGR51DRAFT_574979 [Nemania sp. FL0031]
MVQPLAVLESLGLRDWAVSVATFGSLLVQLIVVFAPGLVSINWTAVTRDDARIIRETTLTTNSSNLKAEGHLDYLTTRGIFQHNLTFPRGSTENFTYETIRPDENNLIELRTTVNGFEPGLFCEPASLSSTSLSSNVVVDAGDYGPLIYQVFNVLINSQSCRMSSSFNFTSSTANVELTSPNGTFPAGQSSTPFGKLLIGHCDHLTGLEASRVTLLVGVAHFFWDSFAARGASLVRRSPSYLTSSIIHHNSTKATPTFTSIVATATISGPSYFSSVLIEKPSLSLCRFDYALPRLNLVQNGTSLPNVSLAQGLSTSATPGDINPWNFMDVILGSHPGPSEQLLTLKDHNTTMVSVDQLTNGIFQSLTLEDAGLLFDYNYLTAAISNYFKVFATQVARRTLLQSTSQSSQGSATAYAYRLTIDTFTCHFLAGLVFTLAVFSIIIRGIVRLQGGFQSSIGTILGRAVTYTGGPTMKSFPNGIGPLCDKEFRLAIHHAFSRPYEDNPASNSEGFLGIDRSYTGNISPIIPSAVKDTSPSSMRRITPVSLRLITVGIIGITLVALIVLLEILLQVSLRNHGLAEFSDTPSIFYLWKILPAVVFGSVALYFRAADDARRILMPYQFMSGQPQSESSLSLDVANRTLPSIIKIASRFRAYSILTAAMAASFASLLTIFSAPLFQELLKPETFGLPLQTHGSFNIVSYENLPLFPEDSYNNLDENSAFLILRNNLSYPPNTFQDLGFFRMTIGNGDINDVSSSMLGQSDKSIHAVLPATRARLNCRLPKFEVDFERSMINVTGEECRASIYVDIHHGVSEPVITNTMFYLPKIGESPQDLSFGWVGNETGCSTVNYAWGQIFNYTKSGDPVIHASVLSCNETVQVVEVNTSLRADNLILDANTTPRTIETSAKTLFTAPFPNYDYYPGLIKDGAAGQLDYFFGLLTTSRYAIPLNDLGNISKAAEVAEAIRFQHGIIRAQTYKALWRDAPNPNGTIMNPNGGYIQFKDDRTRTAKIEKAQATRRLALNPTATRVLEALLATVLILHILSAALAPPANILPRSPNYIASVFAMLVDGNISKFLPSDLSKAKGLEEVARDYLFAEGRVCYLGWKQPNGQETGEPRYGIWILTREEAEEARQGEKRKQDATKQRRHSIKTWFNNRKGLTKRHASKAGE